MLIFGEAPYLECSSKGDKRFSAFFARIDGKSIEELYQAYKIFSDGSTGLTWREAKGKQAINQEQCAIYYRTLWRTYINRNPTLINVIKAYSGFTDIFGKTGHCCQAEEIWLIKCGIA